MTRLTIPVSNIVEVLQVFDQIKIYTGTSEDGPFTDSLARIDLDPTRTVYVYDDENGIAGGTWYKISYLNSISLTESELSSPQLAGIQNEKTGYTFGNYSPSSDVWGKILTADDVRYTYLWGIDATAHDRAQSDFADQQIDYYLNVALDDFEHFLTIDIRKRIYKTNPASSLKRAKYWNSKIDYTDEENPYPFEPLHWNNFGFLQLRHMPLISVERCILLTQVDTTAIDLLNQNWVRVDKHNGTIHLFPRSGLAYGPYAIGAMPWRLMGIRYPQGFEVDYTAGFATSDDVPDSLREVIAKWAVIKILTNIGDGIYAGIASQSTSLDGLSESVSFTQTASTTFFGARIKQYGEDIKTWIEKNRYKYSPVPMTFVGM